MPKDSTPATRDAAAAVHALSTAFASPATQGSMALATRQATDASHFYSMDKFEAIGQMASRFVASRLYGETTVEQAFIKLQSGYELGIPPTVAMDMIHLIKNKKCMGSQLMIYLINRAGHKFEILESTDKIARVRITRNNGVSYETSFSMDDARRAGLAAKDNYRNYPDVMILNRATSKNARYICPEVLGGIVYTPEDMDVTVSPDGRLLGVVDVQPEPPAAGNPQALTENKKELQGVIFDVLAQRIKAVRGDKTAKAEADIADWRSKLDAGSKKLADMETWVSLLEAKKAEASAKAAAKAAVPPPPAAPAPAPAADPDDPRDRAWQDIQATLASQGKDMLEIEATISRMKADWSCFHPDDQLDHMLAWLREQNGGA